jgi:hypothetical protein
MGFLFGGDLIEPDMFPDRFCDHRHLFALGETGRSNDRVDPSAAAWVEQVGQDDVGDVGLVDG